MFFLEVMVIVLLVGVFLALRAVWRHARGGHGHDATLAQNGAAAATAAAAAAGTGVLLSPGGGAGEGPGACAADGGGGDGG